MPKANTENTEAAPKRPLSSSLEDYLEAIYWLSQPHGVARGGQIAEQLNVSKPSVTAALKALAEKGYINYDPYQFISLTRSGKALARDIVWRHDVLKRFFTELLGVDETRAEETACRVEHLMDHDIMDRLRRLVESRAPEPRTTTR